ncbi:hypothetical protein TRVL_07024 [Trypanosoma vivax]|nr:hypothetical protein TRVL_07024 [Trypanosoma vivax]
MSDVLAILDGVSARVSTLLMSEGLDALIAFLSGDLWDQVDVSKGDNMESTCSFLIPNTLTRSYEFIPLAIAADVLLGPSSSHRERTALVEEFRHHGFHVFDVDLVSDACSSTDAVRGVHKSSTGMLRRECMEAAWSWCELCYSGAEDENCKRERWTRAAGAKRVRGDGAFSSVEKTGVSNATGDTEPQGVRRLFKHQKGLLVRRVLFIVRCRADENGGARYMGGGAVGVRRVRCGRDSLQLLLHDIGALATLCRARNSKNRIHILFSVLLLPDDLAYGGTLLEESLSGPMGRDYCVRLFCASGVRGTSQVFEDLCGNQNEEHLEFLQSSQSWPKGYDVNSARGRENGSDSSGAIRSTRGDVASQNVCTASFFVRQQNLPFCCFLWEALRRFPVILQLASLQRLQSLWSLRHQMGDVVIGFHALLCPFRFSSQRHSPLSALGDADSHERIGYLADTTDLLNIIFSAAGKWAGGHPLGEAVAFCVLYVDVLERRPLRLGRIPELKEFLKRRANQLGGNNFFEKLNECIFSSPSDCIQRNLGTQVGSEQQAIQDIVLPPTMTVASAKIPLFVELLRTVLVSMLPLSDSLDEISQVTGCLPDKKDDRFHGPCVTFTPHCESSFGLSHRNFFSPLFSDSTRLLYILTVHAMSQPNARLQYVSLAILRRVCQLSDEVLIRSLVELQFTGMVTVNMRELKARSLLFTSS